MDFFKTWSVALALFVSFSVQAQSNKVVQGFLRDSLSRPIAGASVQYIAGTDTLKTSSSVGGIYTFNNLKDQSFKIKVSSLGFEPFEKNYTFAPVEENRMLVPNIILLGIPNMLEEVVINGVVTVQVKGDTVEYSTKDLKLREGSVAEDALKKLQGVEVDKDGNVTAQGEQVTRVRINGKDFFGGDVKTATQNLPANIIEKMQIVDDFGDMANITGNKSGESTKVLNIQIDPKYNEGYVTTLRVGGGTEERYQTTGMFMGFKDKSQVSVLGNLNNMNANLFDFNAMGGGARGRQGGGGGRGPGGMFGGSEGITNTGSIGVNIRHDFSDKLKAYGSYSYGRDDNNTLSNSFTEFLGDQKGLTRELEDDKNSIRADHRFEGNLEWNISDKDYIKITPQLGFSDNTTRSVNTATYLKNLLKDNIQVTDLNSGSNAPRYNFSGLYNRKLNNKGRNLFFNLNYDNAVTENEFNEILNQKIYDPANQNESIKDVYVQTLRDAQNKSWNAGASVSYTEPLSEKSKLEVTYDFNNNDYDNKDKQNAYDINNQLIADPELSGVKNYVYNYDYAFTTHRVGASFMYDNEKIKYSIGAAVQPSLLKGNASSADASAAIDRSNFNIMPIARFEYKFSKQSNITINYSGKSVEPTLSQILPFEVSTNRTNVTLGNSDLDPEFNHSLRMRFRSGDFQKGKTFFAMLRGEYTQDKIVTMSRRYAKEGDGIFQETGYQNESDPVYSLSTFYHWGRSLKEKTYNIMYGGGVNYNHGISYLNQNETGGTFDKVVTNNTVISQMLFFRYNPSENLEINPGVRYSYNMTSTSLAKLESPNTSKVAPSIIGSVNITPTTIFGADVSKEFNRGYASNVNPFIINTYVEQKLLKGQRGTIRLQAFDLLNEQVNINRTVAQELTDSRTNRLARYFMLTFTFKLQKFSGVNPMEDNSNRFHGGMRPPRM
ncbi:outer membrane beta-barrel protein [Sphingobacterium yanglingense]|uniref:Outer membrane receptor protein involved in Fe transport n=1 Tax=Sphingobacterium yanglingense TaxID=1437280 RepID=A0A4R6W449_9SPHI|nr:outer membrane beta-barrel protein [Sphingobacterium yanglingense]TDQ73348.1 outer membrane receptor protein involved in Fe transport [Sphingobacterium yanglingense]